MQVLLEMQFLQLMVIFDRKALKPDMTVGEVPGTFYGLSESGWMDSELFEEWFKHHFLRYAPPIRPLILLLDGHSSHYQPNFIRTALAEKVIIFCLPPHSTHILQPLDNGVFGSLKKQCMGRGLPSVLQQESRKSR